MIDYRKARILDSKWWRHLRVCSEALERQGRATLLSAALQHHLALVSNSGLTEESFEKSQEAAKEGYYNLVGAVRPWEGRSYVERQQQEAKSWRQRYIDSTGADPCDPKFKEWEAQKIAAWQAKCAKKRDNDPEKKVLQRLRDKARNKRK